MTRPRRDVLVYTVIATVLLVALMVLLFVGPRWLTTAVPVSETARVAVDDARKIRARLFYVTENGTHLSAVEQEVAYGEGIIGQAKRIIEAQLAPPKDPIVSAIPAGTTLKSIFLTAKGEAYVDFSPELHANHPGGTTNEILTVYAIVNALTSNLPAITGVQILIDGKEVDTLAGHLDLRRPIEHDARWIGQ
jgi:spore germination protein GerM